MYVYVYTYIYNGDDTWNSCFQLLTDSSSGCDASTQVADTVLLTTASSASPLQTGPTTAGPATAVAVPQCGRAAADCHHVLWLRLQLGLGHAAGPDRRP